MVNRQPCANDIGTQLYCLANMETKTGQLFEEFANKTVLSDIKSPLLKIAQDDKKHAEELFAISEKLGHSNVKQKDCERKMKPVCDLTDSIRERVMSKEKLTLEELSNFLALLENPGGSVNFLRVQAETFIYMSKEMGQMYGIDFAEFDKQLTDGAQLIEEHISLLEDIKEKIAENTPQQKTEHHPFVKYQTPDAWYQPVAK